MVLDVADLEGVFREPLVRAPQRTSSSKPSRVLCIGVYDDFSAT